MALCFWLPYRRHFAIARTWARCLFWMLERLCGLKYSVEGRERIPPGNHIVMSNHASAWETVAQFVIFPPQVWVLKRELLWIPFVGWGLKLLRPIAINRAEGHRAVHQVIEQGKERLAAGLWVIIFPEGTRVVAGADPQVRRERRAIGRRHRQTAGAAVAQCRGFLAEAGFLEEARHGSRDHRRADRPGGQECEGSHRGSPPRHRGRIVENPERGAESSVAGPKPSPLASDQA